GVGYLLGQFDNRQHVLAVAGRGEDASYFAGMDALAVYALLQAGQATDDPRLAVGGPEGRAMLDAVKALPATGSYQTYARGLRAACLALFNRPADLKVLKEDADWLLGTTDGGAYTYDGPFRPLGQRGTYASRNGAWDNSNSQYGLLGVWSATEAEPRVEVPLAYWRAVARHWTTHQSPDGQWGYVGNQGGQLTMTCAGIASLFVAHEYDVPPLAASGDATVGRDPYPPALRRGLAWFETANNAVSLPDGGSWWGYGLYGIERVGLASGFKQFGSHDWYRELSARVLRRQREDGSWGDGVVDTSYAVLFLSRGRHPVMMNKLRFDGTPAARGYWANRPRDLANLTRFTARQIERPLNWQVVSADVPWTDWADSSILYVASHRPPPLDREQEEKMRRFALAGGLIFTHADGGVPAAADGARGRGPNGEPLTFDAWARDLAGRLFPRYTLAPVPDAHPLWSSVYPLTNRRELWGVSNGSRLLMVHAPQDVALPWQQRLDRAFEAKAGVAPRAAAGPSDPGSEPTARAAAVLAPFQFGLNLFVYAAGKRDLRNRLDSAWVPEPATPAVDAVPLARLEHAGNWDPEPAAWERYANWLHRATGTRVVPKRVRMADLTAAAAADLPLAHLTGTARVGFTDADVAGLRAYVRGGGVVLVDPTGGLNEFYSEVVGGTDPADGLLARAFPGVDPRTVDLSHPLLTASAPGMEDCRKPRVRLYTRDRSGLAVATVQMLVPDARPGTGAVIVTSLDLTSGLLGTNAWGIQGFEPKYAQNLVKNVIFWTLDGRRQKP
ncbi:MAG: A-macroglobulin complement component, partial [Phycisphaerales bacterium]|nr:A-macroglobulin complement component [Phycisphaerales bacterium]